MRTNRLFALQTLTLIAAAPTAAIEAPDLSGSWQLNAELSETLREKAREKMSSSGTDPRAQLRRERMAARERGTLASAPFSRLDVSSSPELVEIRYRDGSLRSVHTDGRELGDDPARGVQGASAAWLEGSLVIESRTARGLRVERWRLSDDGARLFVSMELDAGERLGQIEFTRVYDRQPEEPAAEPSESSADDVDSGSR